MQAVKGDKSSWRQVMRPVTGTNGATGVTTSGTAAADVVPATTTTTTTPVPTGDVRMEAVPFVDNGWDVWGDWERAANVHYSFLDNVRANRLQVRGHIARAAAVWYRTICSRSGVEGLRLGGAVCTCAVHAPLAGCAGGRAGTIWATALYDAYGMLALARMQCYSPPLSTPPGSPLLILARLRTPAPGVRVSRARGQPVGLQRTRGLHPVAHQHDHVQG